LEPHKLLFVQCCLINQRNNGSYTLSAGGRRLTQTVLNDGSGIELEEPSLFVDNSSSPSVYHGAISSQH